MDIERTFSALCEIYRDEPDRNVRKHLLDAIKRLAHYDLELGAKWDRGFNGFVGIIQRMEADDRVALRPLLITVLSEVWSPAYPAQRGRRIHLFEHRRVAVSDESKTVREKAMSGCLTCWDNRPRKIKKDK